MENTNQGNSNPKTRGNAGYPDLATPSNFSPRGTPSPPENADGRTTSSANPHVPMTGAPNVHNSDYGALILDTLRGMERSIIDLQQDNARLNLALAELSQSSAGATRSQQDAGASQSQSFSQSWHTAQPSRTITPSTTIPIRTTSGETSRQPRVQPRGEPTEFEARICELEAMVTRIPGVPALVPHIRQESFVDSPFADHITSVEMPDEFAFPSMKLFDETTDPDGHVTHYKQRMFAVSVPRVQREACMCKGFGSSLVGLALQWYTSLLNSSIDSFAGIHSAFLEQFASSRKPEKHPDDLYSIKQGETKSLRSFVARFNREKVSIPGCTLSTTISAFRKGLRTDTDLYKELTKYSCRTMEDIINKTQAQIKWEEDEANRQEITSSRSPSSKLEASGYNRDSEARRDRRADIHEPRSSSSRSTPYQRMELRSNRSDLRSHEL